MSLDTEPTAPLTDAVTNEALDRLFRTARSFSFWLQKPVADQTLHRLYDLIKWASTSANSSPARLLFLRSPEAKQRLVLALAATNVEKVLAAPVTVIIGYDLRFYDRIPKLFPHAPGYRDVFA